MQIVCKDCFSDKELRGFIISQSKIGNCDCCGSQNIEIIKTDELLDFFQELFDNFEKSDSGESIVDRIQRNWNLFSSSENAAKLLKVLIPQLSNVSFEILDNVDFIKEIKENVNYWNILKDQLRWKRRYLTDMNILIEDLGWDAFFNSQISIEPGDLFYRARLHSKQNEKPYPIDEMFCPPKDLSTAGRANPAGIPYLYLSDNIETVPYEIRASYLDEISIGTFTPKESLKNEILISDFTEAPTLFHPSEINKKIKSTLLKKRISEDLSKPLRRYDTELDYIPTQFICEFINIITDVNGIKFRSSLHPTGNNLVIFDQNIMKCLSVEKAKITDVNINFLKSKAQLSYLN